MLDPALRTSPSPTRAGDPIPGERIEALRRALANTVDAGYFAGVTSCVVQRGKLLECDAFGFRDIDDATPMTTDTLFRIASSTKPIIAAAMLVLREEGRWSLEDPVAVHIPAFEGLKVRGRDGELTEPVQPMRMRHLMSHSAGFAQATSLDPTAARNDPAARRALRALFSGTLQDLIDRLAAEPLAFHPGKRFLYGPCVDVQGYLIEKLSGQSLDAFLRERIFAPLGMDSTGFWVERADAHRVASLYRYSGGALSRIQKPDPERIAHRPTFLSGGGGLWSTPNDYQRFCQMLLDEGLTPTGGQLLAAESVRSLREDLLEPEVDVRVVAGYVLPGARFGMNVSVITEPQGDNAMYGRDTYSWGGAFGTYFWVDPTHELFVSGMVQIANGGAQHLGLATEYPDLKRLSASILYGVDVSGAEPARSTPSA